MFQVKNESVLTSRFREINSIPDDASDIQIQVGIHATKISYSMPYKAPVVAEFEKPLSVPKKKAKKKVAKQDD